MPVATQLLGIASIVIGCFLISIPLGFIAGGVLLTLLGVAMERNRGAE